MSAMLFPQDFGALDDEGERKHEDEQQRECEGQSKVEENEEERGFKIER